ncbi:MAG: hypothetical protein WA476_21695, partial [Acidobacteriaceae bacterium]
MKITHLLSLVRIHLSFTTSFGSLEVRPTQNDPHQHSSFEATVSLQATDSEQMPPSAHKQSARLTRKISARPATSNPGYR